MLLLKCTLIEGINFFKKIEILEESTEQKRF